MPPPFVKKQINAGLEDVGADAVKLGEWFVLFYFLFYFFPPSVFLGPSICFASHDLTSRIWRRPEELTRLAGMLSSSETVEVIADTLTAYKVPYIVLDPVFRSSFHCNFS